MIARGTLAEIERERCPPSATMSLATGGLGVAHTSGPAAAGIAVDIADQVVGLGW